MAWADRHRPALHDLFDGSDGAEPRRADADARTEAEREPVALDHRHLRLHGRRLPDDHGYAWRPDRAAKAADGRRGLFRPRLDRRRFLDQRRDADRHARRARHRRRDACAVHALAHHRDVRGREGAHLRHLDVDRELFRRCDHRADRRRRPDRICLVGRSLPDRGAADGAAARDRPVAAAGIQGPQRRPDRPRQRAALAMRRARADLRRQALGRSGLGAGGAGRDGGRRRARPRLHQAAGAPARSDGRSGHVQDPRLQRGAGDQSRRHPVHVRQLHLPCAVFPARRRSFAAAGGALVAALGDRLHCRLLRHAGAGRPLPARHAYGWRHGAVGGGASSGSRSRQT